MISFAARVLRAFVKYLPMEREHAAPNDFRHDELRAFAYQQAELLRDGHLSRQEALAAITGHFPELASRQADEALARALFDSR